MPNALSTVTIGGTEYEVWQPWWLWKRYQAALTTVEIGREEASTPAERALANDKRMDVCAGHVATCLRKAGGEIVPGISPALSKETDYLQHCLDHAEHGAVGGDDMTGSVVVALARHLATDSAPDEAPKTPVPLAEGESPPDPDE